MSNISLHDDAPVDEIDEQLVAYLDGELHADEVRLLEQKLGADDSLRARLRELQNGWDMLDELPLASSSTELLETTIRMAAIEGSAAAPGKVLKQRLSRVAWIAIATACCFVLGIGLMKVRDYLRYQKQLRDLPIALHLDALLHASDLELMRKLDEMPQWQAAVAMADQLGKWDVSLASQIDTASVKDRARLLPTLPIEDQKTVAAAWERFENISPLQRQTAQEMADKVEQQPDAEDLLKTMDRFAAWRASWRASDRDRLGTDPDPDAFLISAMERTTRQWTQESASKISDADVETIYQALRQIARLRLKAIHRGATPEVKALVESFGSSNQSMDPQIEASFLRRMFDQGGPPMPPGYSPGGPSPMFNLIRSITDNLRGPLRDYELDMLQSVLPKKWADAVEAKNVTPEARENVLTTLSEESLKRVQWSRSGRTVAERYQSSGDDDREEIDLLPADQMLRRLDGSGFGFGRR
jgi:hypothetical protein